VLRIAHTVVIDHPERALDIVRAALLT